MGIADEIIPYTVNGRIAGVRLANFRNDSDEPLASHKLWLEQAFVPVMRKNPGARISIIGMASRNGDAKYNEGLSQRRINKVEAIISAFGHVNIVTRKARGEDEAADDGYKDGDRSGRYRAVLLKWEGLTGPAPTPPKPGPGPAKFKKVLVKTQPGVWLITGVDAFGLPFPVVTAGRVVVTLLNDKGEQWAITGFGAGPSVGVEIPFVKDLKFFTKFLVDLGLKLGDIPNLADKVKDTLPDLPSATSGGVFRVNNIVSNFTIQEITAKKFMTIASGAMSLGAGGELGSILFDSIKTDANGPTAQILAGVPWGLYSSLGTGKVGAEISGVVYRITGVAMKGLLEREVLDIP